MSFRAKASVGFAFTLAVVATTIAAGLYFRFQSPVPIAFGAIQREPSVPELLTKGDAYLEYSESHLVHIFAGRLGLTLLRFFLFALWCVLVSHTQSMTERSQFIKSGNSNFPTNCSWEPRL